MHLLLTHQIFLSSWLLQLLTSIGANARDPSIRRAHVEDREPEDEKDFINGKRLMLLEVYNKLKQIGFDISEDDFVLADSTDRRTSMILFQLRREKENMDLDCAARGNERVQSALGIDLLMEVQEKVKAIIDGMDLPMNISTHLRNRMEDWMGRDLSEHKKVIYYMLLEAV